MKTQTPFWPLLKNELTLGRSGSAGTALLAYWLLVGAIPLMVLFGDSDARGNIASVFDAGFLPIIAFMFLTSLTLWITYATVPAFCDVLSPAGVIPGALQNLTATEFLFTRAVDREILFRARATAFFLFAMTPLFLDMAASPFAPDITFSPAASTPAELLRRQERYLRVFPGSHAGTSHATIVPSPLAIGQTDKVGPYLVKAYRRPVLQTIGPQTSQIVIPHGAVAYMAWLAWNATLAFPLLQGYGTMIARHVKPHRWWTAVFPLTPIFCLLSAFLILARVGFGRMHINLSENSFLFFSAHPLAMVIALTAVAVIVQLWCERRFSKLEVF